MSDDLKKPSTPPAECSFSCGLREAIDRGFGEMREALSESAHDRADLRTEVNALKVAQDKPSDPDIVLTAALDAEVKARKQLDEKVDKLLDVATRAESWWTDLKKNRYLKIVGVALVVYAVRYLESHGVHTFNVLKGVLP